MPSTYELYRLNKLLSEMPLTARNQFIADTISWLETEERDRCTRPEELQAVQQFGNYLKTGMQLPRIEVAWTHQIFIDHKNNPYFIRFLKRSLPK